MPALQPRERTPAYLTPCPGCGAENGITAMACWQCDRQLLPDPPPPSGGLWPPAPSDAASAAVPTLNDAVSPSDRAANDSMLEATPGPESESEAPRSPTWPTWALGTVAAVVALSFADVFGPPAPTAAPRVAQVAAPPVSVVPVRTNEAVTKPMPLVAIAAPHTPEPLPVRAGCTPEVVALGLCNAASQ